MVQALAAAGQVDRLTPGAGEIRKTSINKNRKHSKISTNKEMTSPLKTIRKSQTDNQRRS
jgi:hypothetical protein